MCLTKVNVLTCDYIDFCLAHVTTLTVIYKMYKNCAITFNLHDKLFHRIATIVVFNNVKCANLKSNFKQNLIFRHRARWKKNSYHQSFRMRKFICNFLFPRFFFSDQCWLWMLRSMTLFSSTQSGFLLDLSAPAHGAIQNSFSLGLIINSVKHQMDNL